MRPYTLLLASTLALSLSGCCMEISGGRDSVFQSSLHDDDCKCHQHSPAGRRPVITKSGRPVRKTRPLFAGDRWSESQYTTTSFHGVGGPTPSVCGGVCGGGCGGGCGDWSHPDLTAVSLCGTSDCTALQPVWGNDPGCHSPAWTSDINCSAPAIPSPHFIQADSGYHSPFGMPGPGPSHGPGCNCGQQGHPLPHGPHGSMMHPAPQGHHGPHGPFGHTGPVNHAPGSSLPAQSGQSGPPEPFHAPAAPSQPMSVPPAETPVPMPMPEEIPAPAGPVEQTSWEVPVFPPIP